MFDVACKYFPLTWGFHEEGSPLCSGRGHYGIALLMVFGRRVFHPQTVCLGREVTHFS